MLRLLFDSHLTSPKNYSTSTANTNTTLSYVVLCRTTHYHTLYLDILSLIWDQLARLVNLLCDPKLRLQGENATSFAAAVKALARLPIGASPQVAVRWINILCTKLFG
jgi:hypothetical protein